MTTEPEQRRLEADARRQEDTAWRQTQREEQRHRWEADSSWRQSQLEEQFRRRELDAAWRQTQLRSTCLLAASNTLAGNGDAASVEALAERYMQWVSPGTT